MSSTTLRRLIVISLIVLWEVLPRAGLIPELFLPSLSSTIAAGWNEAGEYGHALAVTLYEVAISMVFACGGGIVAGAVVGSLPRPRVLIMPMISSIYVSPQQMPHWLGQAALWNPLSSTARATRELFGAPTGTGTSWPEQHALLLERVRHREQQNVHCASSRGGENTTSATTDTCRKCDASVRHRVARSWYSMATATSVDSGHCGGGAGRKTASSTSRFRARK